jgi:uncharacterized iron-regulated protein
MLDAPLDKARDRRRALLYAQGARFVKALVERGGWDAVNAAYRSPPRTTAQVLHPEGVPSFTVGFGAAHGEFAIWEMLASGGVAEALEAAAGWRGDSLSREADTSCWVVAFAGAADALQFQGAMVKLRAPERAQVVMEDEGATVWAGPRSAITAVLARAERVYVLEAPDEAGLRRLLDRIDGVSADFRVYSAAEKRFLTFGEALDRLREFDVVCVGEEHDSEPHHRIQLQVIRGLYAFDDSLGVGMEMFQKPFQGILDRYIAGKSSEEEFLKASEYASRWGFPWELYRPIVEFCRRNGVPLAALNAPRELTQRLSKVGYDGLTGPERVQLGDIDFHVEAHRQYWYDRISAMHGNRTPSEEQKERSYMVMTAWDHVMGTTAAEFRRERGLRRVVILAGGGHVDRGIGVAASAARSGAKVATVHVAASFDPAKTEPPADFVVVP